MRCSKLVGALLELGQALGGQVAAGFVAADGSQQARALLAAALLFTSELGQLLLERGHALGVPPCPSVNTYAQPLPSVRPRREYAAMRQFFRWNGSYLGFSADDGLFDPNGAYLGWFEGDGSVWRADGSYAGEIVDNDYIMRCSVKMPLGPRVPRVPPVPPVPLVPPVPRVPRVPMVGWQETF
jgi:hypothetical protein